MATVSRLEDLQIWQLARRFARDIDLMVSSPYFRGETGLRNQMKNASGSVMDNIAEGFGRGSKNEFINHLSIARGSVEEVRSQLYRCSDQQIIPQEVFTDMIARSETLVKKITALMNYLNSVLVKGTKFKNRR